VRALASVLLVAWAACTPVPGSPQDGGEVADASTADAGPLKLVAPPRVFGQKGETPTHLVAAGADRLLALTNAAIYQLDRDGASLARSALPVASSGGRAVVLGAGWDGVGLGALVRWGADTQLPSGTYLALGDATGVIKPATMTRLTAAGPSIRGSFGSTHEVVWIEAAASPQQGASLLHAVATRSAAPTTSTLLSGLAVASAVGGWRGSDSGQGTAALCTVEPGGVVVLRTFKSSVQPTLKQTLTLNDPARPAVGSCRLATSGRSQLVVWTRRALAPALQDAGPHTIDLGSGTLSFDEPVAQLVDPAGQRLKRSVRLSLAYDGPVLVQSVLWDAASGRYLVLLNPVGHRGGRLVLAALDEAGKLLFRDAVVPLDDYEPGRTEAGRLVVTSSGSIHLLYGIRRPWDEGRLYLVQIALRWRP
jgi:hypothetical protein